MLGKIIKNEFKSTYKLMLSIFGVLVLLSLMGGFSVRSLALTTGKVNVVAVLGTVIYFLSFVTVFVIVLVFVGQRFYKTMFSTQGYLTHTLPAKESSIFNGKLLVSYIWVLSVFIMIFLSLIVMGSIASGGELIKIITTEGWKKFLDDFYQEFGFNARLFIVEMVITLLLGICYGILWIFTSLSVGQLSDKHRVAASVFTGIGIYVLEQIVGVVIIANGVKKGSSMVVDGVEAAGRLMNGMIWTSLGYMALMIAVMYLVCLLINKKKLNLE